MYLKKANASTPVQHYIRLATIALVAGALMVRPLGAQLPRSEDIVTVALVADSVIPGNVVIRRQGHGGQRNVILLGRSLATSGVLEHAMQQLIVSRKIRGHVPAQPLMTVMHDGSGGSSDRATQALFNRLLTAPQFNVAGFGMQQAVFIKLTKDVDTPP